MLFMSVKQNTDFLSGRLRQLRQPWCGLVAIGGVSDGAGRHAHMQTARYTPSHTHMETFSCEHLELPI